MRIVSVVGARPNFMKIAPFVEALARRNERRRAAGEEAIFEHCLVHTGQHYDAEMSTHFFAALGIPEPDVDLGIGSGSHAEQVGRTMIAFEGVLRERRPDWVVVVGDVNATCACSITAVKEHVRLAHIEAGLRSFDRRMPEEINRLVTDTLADLLFTTDEIADANLRAAGVPCERIKRVGNIMIDTLMKHKDAASERDVNVIVAHAKVETEADSMGMLEEAGYALLTMHRPSNVDRREVLERIVGYLTDELSVRLPVVWTLHPRTRKRLEEFDLWNRVSQCRGINLVRPLGYLDMMRLNMGARLMLTDSGGLQEECCVLGTPCVTMRENTERPVTLREHGGLSELAGNRLETVRAEVERAMATPKQPHCPPLWDGHAGERIVDVFEENAETLKG